jgi:hypothetical protein
MASTQRIERFPTADAEFQRFLEWRADCHAQSQRLEKMDDEAIPSQFSEHVSHYRYARACALIDSDANPEGAAVEAVRTWLSRSRSASNGD